MGTALILLRKFWFVPLLLGLAIFALFQKIDLTRTKAHLAASEQRVADVTDANKSLNIALAKVQQQRIDNDAIAASVAARVGQGRTIETHTNTVIEKAVKSDPVAKSWADSRLPDSVRAALRADQSNAAPR